MGPLLLLSLLTSVSGPERPNILWITSEDNGPHLGCYGDPDADTPHLDALSERGLRFERCWSNAPVCAPARTTLITGMHATSLGAESMRAMVPLPADVRLFPAYLREAGYYTTNCAKEDYNVPKQGDEWDESGEAAHWRNRPEGQPFFSVFNIATTHEGRIRARPHDFVHDPETVRVPGYHPDDPVVRRDWAQYHDKMTEMDAEVGAVLAELTEDGLAGDTVVFYFGDHGPGMPRCKRSPYDSGLRVPLIVHVPERFLALAPDGYESGALSQRLVSFVDLAPTVLSLAGVEAPDHMQGAAFAGAHPAEAPQHLFGYRGRVDERIDFVRSVTDGRYVYVRNFMPGRIQGAHLAYMFQTPTTQRWKELYDAGALAHPGPPAHRRFWEPKPLEELYVLEHDPDETLDLAAVGGGVHEALGRLRGALREHMLATGDLGFLLESERERRAGEEAPRGIDSYPLAELLELADADAARCTELLVHADPAVRAWAIASLPDLEMEALRSLLEDEFATVRIAAAEALARRGAPEDVAAARSTLLDLANLEESGVYLALAALNTLDLSGALTIDEFARVAALPRKAGAVHRRLRTYVPRLIDAMLERYTPREPFVYKTMGDIELELFVHRPPGPGPEGGRGAVVFFHGGGWNSGEPSQFFDQCEHLARRGIVGISAAYRLGRDGATPDQCVADAKSALRWVRDHAAELGVDPGRIAAGGGSAGGQIAAAAGTVAGFDDDPESDVSARPDALVLFNAVFDNGPDGWGHERVREYWESFSPLHNISAETPPSLVMLGTADSLVPVETAELWRARTQEAGVRCVLKLYEGQPHGFFNRQRNAEMYRATVGAMDAFLGSLGWN